MPTCLDLRKKFRPYNRFFTKHWRLLLELGLLVMPRRVIETANGAVLEHLRTKKRIASNGNRLPDPIREGEILTDITKNEWKLGRSIGVGGFGEIYLASNNISRPVGPDAQQVVKVEPHKNGPLFVEINCYIRVAKSLMIEEWKKKRRLKHLGLSPFIGSGSHTYRGEKYRFLVLERFGEDLGKVFLRHGRKFPIKTAFTLGIQILDSLEYIHSHGYIHADIKGSNLLLGHRKGTENCVYLLDYGLACRYEDRYGIHKEYRCDERTAHNGTLEYTSRDAHIGAHSRRGDLEILGYNLLQWLCGRLPWEDSVADPEYVHLQKKSFMNNIPLLMRRCFPDVEPPSVLSQYLKYVVSLGFETKPDYSYCRELLRQGIEEAGYKDDGKLVFGACPRPKINKSRKRKATEEPENIAELKPKKIIRNVLRQPCVAHNFNRMTRNSPTSPVLRSHQQFSWEKIISGNPEKRPMKKHPPIINRRPSKSETMRVSVHRTKQKLQAAMPVNEEPTRPRPPVVDDSLSNPTPAMKDFIARRQLRSTTPGPWGWKKSKSESRCSSPVESPFPFPITPAMAQVLRRREELRQMEIEDSLLLEDEENLNNTTYSEYLRSCEDIMSSSEEEEEEVMDEEEEFVRATRSRSRFCARKPSRTRSSSRTRGKTRRRSTSVSTVGGRRRSSTCISPTKKTGGSRPVTPVFPPRMLRNYTLRG